MMERQLRFKRKAHDQPSAHQLPLRKSHKIVSLSDEYGSVLPAERMKPSAISFLSLPRELRDLIYEYSLHYDGLQRAIDTFNIHFPTPRAALSAHATIPKWLQTPSVLLLNRQIHGEARKVLSSRILQIDRPILAMDFEGHGISLSNAISRETLEAVRHVRLNLSICHLGNCTGMHESGAIYHSFGNWSDETGDSFLLYSDAWAVLLVNCLDVWLTKNSLESLEVAVRGLSISTNINNMTKVSSPSCSVLLTAKLQ
jgi:hypothetical protein